MLVGEVFARMGLDSKDYEKGLNKLEGYTQKRALTLGTIFKGAFSFALGIGVIQGFRSLGGAITDFVNTAARTEVLNVAMQSVARSSGYMLAAVEADKRAVMELGIAEQEATQILTRFMQAQLDTADAAKLARVAQDAAVIAGYNSSQAAEQMTEAIAKQRPELLSAFGMTRNMNEIYNDYAGTVGKTAAQLSEFEKKQAMLNYILAEGDKIAGTYEASMGAVGKQIGSLPRYWDTLKNAIAKPLALPALSVIVDGITNALKNAISWAEANKVALQTWGQTAANVAGFVIRSFQGVARVFIDNWGAIRFVATALLTYVAAARTAAFVTTQFGYVSQVLSGSLVKTTGFLGWLTRAVSAYRSMTITATIGTNIFSAALVRARFAAQALLASIPVVGWALLALSVAAGAAVSSWSKYSAKVQEAAQKAHMEKIASQTQDMAESALGAADGQDDLADALGEAGKAAGKNLQSFDEVHTLQEDMAAATSTLDDLDFGLGGDMGDLVGFDIGDLMSEMDAAKPTLAGWWEDIKQTWRARWEIFTGWLGGVWDGVKEKWKGFTGWISSWGIWTTLKEKWGNFKEWAGNLWEGVKEKWGNFKEWAGNLWEGVKEKWGNFTGWVQEKWSSFKTKAGEIWTGIKTNVQTKWEELKTNAPVIWEDIKTSIQTRWENLKTNAGETWNNITTGIKEKWNNLKTNAPTVWENIKTSIQDRWDSLVSGASEKWGNIKSTISEKWGELKTNAPTVWENIRKSIGDKWEELKTNAPITWEEIKKEITDRWEALKKDAPKTWGETAGKLADIWEGIKTSASEKWEGVKTVIKGAVNGIIEIINWLINQWNSLKFEVPSITIGNKTFGGYTVGVPQITPITPLAKGGLVTAPTLAMLGEAGPEAVVPLGRSGFAEDLADTVAQAVYRAVMDAVRVSQASAGGDDREIVLKIDNTALARMQLPAIIREGQRQGLDLVVQPQGV